MEEPRYRGPAYETARLKLARIRVEGRESRDRAAKYLTRVSAEALGVARVGLWLLRDGRRLLLSHCIYRRKTDDFDIPHELKVASCGALSSLLEQRRLFALESKEALLSLGDFGALLSSQLSVTSILCTPIIREGRVIGALTFEQVGPCEPFAQKQLEFASSVADLTVLIFEQAERVELEVALQANAEARHEMQKMQALIRLSRTVAHDLNNLLTVVGAVGEALYTEDTPKSNEWAQELLKAVELGGQLTEHLLTFSGEKPPSDGPVDLARIIHDMEPVLRPLTSPTRQLVLETGTEPALAIIDALSVQQLLLNLVRNAFDALRDPGRVVIRLREPQPEDALRAGAIVLEVDDDGRGMDPETQARAVEPYFTTKKHGHGLGLSTVFGIAQRYGGGVRITSNPNDGTRVAIALLRG